MADDKLVATRFLKEEYSRDFVFSRDTLNVRQFIKRHSIFISKPLSDYGGHGVTIINLSEIGSRPLDITSKDLILEEIIIQKGLLHDLHPSSVNTLRVITLLRNGESEFLHSFLRTGRNGAITDNTSSGGIAWQVDSDTGIIGKGYDDFCNIYERHPDTNMQVSGHTIPHYKKAIEFCLKAHKKIPRLGLFIYQKWAETFSPNSI